MGRVFDIQRFSIHDGPGIRTTVFLKGCPLRCLWCHNPEGIDPCPRLAFSVERCLGCGECVVVCPQYSQLYFQRVAQHGETRPTASSAVMGEVGEDSGKQPLAAPALTAPSALDPVLPASPGIEPPPTASIWHLLAREDCTGCGACAAVCPTGALELAGREMGVEQVMCEVLRDQAFYAASGGGLTLSGGEPLLQYEFTRELLTAAKEARLHCCLETSGFAAWRQIESLLPLVDMFLYDLKETDPDRHFQYTAQPLAPILENLRKLVAAGAKVVLRCPIVPGYNDREEHLAAVAALAGELPSLEGVEVLPYHPLGEAKRARFGLPPLQGLPDTIPSRDTVANWQATLASHGVRLVSYG